MLQFEVLILELVAIDGLSTGAITSCKVTSLDHEIFDDPVERGPLKSKPLLTRSKCSEVLSGLEIY